LIARDSLIFSVMFTILNSPTARLENRMCNELNKYGRLARAVVNQQRKDLESFDVLNWDAACPGRMSLAEN